MKFNWGTGILIFLILFVSAAAVFIVFAMRQDVNLVHEDYYEKGADHTERMKVEARSVVYTDSVQTSLSRESLLISLAGSITANLDSGTMLLFRPSSRSLDLEIPLLNPEETLKVPKTSLSPGRYIMKLKWFADGLEYSIDQTVFIK